MRKCPLHFTHWDKECISTSLGFLVWSVPAFSLQRFSWRSLNWNLVINCTHSPGAFLGFTREESHNTLLLQSDSCVEEINLKIHMWGSHQPFLLRDSMENLQLYYASVSLPVVWENINKKLWSRVHCITPQGFLSPEYLGNFFSPCKYNNNFLRYLKFKLSLFLN